MIINDHTDRRQTRAAHCSSRGMLQQQIASPARANVTNTDILAPLLQPLQQKLTRIKTWNAVRSS